jgi:hypothetical protein
LYLFFFWKEWFQWRMTGMVSRKNWRKVIGGPYPNKWRREGSGNGKGELKFGRYLGRGLDYKHWKYPNFQIDPGEDT